MNTLQEMQRILGDAAEAITAPIHVTRNTAEAYHRHLNDIDTDLLQASVDYCVENEGAFFPSVHAIRSASREILSLSIGLPSPAEAWAMVMSAKTFQSAVFCEMGAGLRDRLKDYMGGQYLVKIKEYTIHTDQCDVCKDASQKAIYNHPAVASTVRVLGGHDALFTGNMSADRARFIEAYREIVERELRVATLHPSIKSLVSKNNPKLLVDANVSSLVKKMSV